MTKNHAMGHVYHHHVSTLWAKYCSISRTGTPWSIAEEVLRDVRKSGDVHWKNDHTQGAQPIYSGKTNNKISPRLKTPVRDVGPVTFASQGRHFRSFYTAHSRRHETHQWPGIRNLQRWHRGTHWEDSHHVSQSPKERTFYLVPWSLISEKKIFNLA